MEENLLVVLVFELDSIARIGKKLVGVASERETSLVGALGGQRAVRRRHGRRDIHAEREARGLGVPNRVGGRDRNRVRLVLIEILDLLASERRVDAQRAGSSYTQKLWMGLRTKAAYLPG